MSTIIKTDKAAYYHAFNPHNLSKGVDMTGNKLDVGDYVVFTGARDSHVTISRVLKVGDKSSKLLGYWGPSLKTNRYMLKIKKPANLEIDMSAYLKE